MENYQENTIIQRSGAKKAFLALIGILLATILFMIANLESAQAWKTLALILSIGGLFVLSKRYFWILAAVIVPLIAFGQSIGVKIKGDWIYDMSLSEAVVFAAFVLFIFLRISGKIKDKVKFHPVALLLGLYLAAAMLSYWQIEDRQLYISGLKVATVSMLAFFVSNNLVRNMNRMKWFLYGLSAAAVLISAEIAYTFYKMGFSTRIFFERSSITIPLGAIALASAILVFILPIILSFYYSLPTSNKVRPFIFLAFLSGWVGAFLTLGKGAILSLLIAMAYLFIKLKKKRTVFLLTLFTFVVIGSIVLAPYFSGLLTRIMNTFTDSNTEFRLTEYKVDWQIIKEHPWFGVGSGQQLLYYQELIHPDYRELANNFLVQAALDLGLIGIVIMLGIFANLLRKAFSGQGSEDDKRYVLYCGFTASLIAAIVNGMVEVTLFALPYAVVFWATMGAFMNLNNSQTSQKN